jgi:hypothetical protein
MRAPLAHTRRASGTEVPLCVEVLLSGCPGYAQTIKKGLSNGACVHLSKQYSRIDEPTWLATAALASMIAKGNTLLREAGIARSAAASRKPSWIG